MLRSYVLSNDTAHYDEVIRVCEKRGLKVIPAFAGGLDARPAVEKYFIDSSGVKVDAILSLTGFSLVGGPAYNDTPAAIEMLKTLDVPYLAAHPLEFQTLAQWAGSQQGLGPIETTMLIALPELDGATNPTVFAGRHGEETCFGCALKCTGEGSRALAPCFERIEILVSRVEKLATLHRSSVAERKVAIILFGFPPNAGAAGTAAYLNVFASLFNTMKAMEARGYTMNLPNSVNDCPKGNCREIWAGSQCSSTSQC